MSLAKSYHRKRPSHDKRDAGRFTVDADANGLPTRSGPAATAGVLRRADTDARAGTVFAGARDAKAHRGASGATRRWAARRASSVAARIAELSHGTVEDISDALQLLR